MISIDEALEQLLAVIRPGVEAHAELRSDRDDPPFDKSAMDGYAINTFHTEGPRRIIGTLYAGEDPSTYALGPDECLKIMTGACVPHGADAVVPIEQCRIDHGSMVLATESCREALSEKKLPMRKKMRFYYRVISP